jgi:WD40 repeat protein
MFGVGAAEPTVRPVSEKAGDRIGHYKLLQQIGEGSYGVVYMAEQEEPVRRRVAFKIIKLGMDTREVVARFEAERQALALMDHPNIARIFDGGATSTGRPYFVMELVRGTKITDYCDQHSLTAADRIHLFTQVCHAIQHAHQKGVIHRDIKPSNVLVMVHDDVPMPKVIDFGIAKAIGERLTDKTIFTRFEQFIGTPSYMSPEQAGLSGLDVDTRSDTYALGVLLYELLTGRTPFDPKQLAKASLEEMLRRIREEDPPKPSTRLRALQPAELTTTAQRRQTEPLRLISLLRGDLDWIVMKCLEKNRARRYETANALALDLDRYLSHQPVTAAAPTLGYRMAKFIRRHRAGLAVVSALVALLVAGVLVSTWQAVRATRAERVAASQRERAKKGEQHAKESELAARQNLYAANMNLVQQAWEQNDVAQVRRLLEETATYPGRGFEWYYWQRQTHRELKTLRGHVGWVRDVAFSTDGQRIVTAGDDQTAKVWEAASGRGLLILKGHGGAIRSVAFSRDGQRILTAGDDQTAKLWEAATGKELQTFRGHSSGISSAAFCPDGQRIVTGSEDDTAKVWEAATGKELQIFKGHSDRISSVAFSPDGQRIVSGGQDGTARVWDATTGNELLTLKGHGGFIFAVAFSPDGQRIVTAGDDQTAKLWEAATGKELLTFRGHSSFIYAVAFSPDGQRIVTSSWDQTARVWEVASGSELFALKGHTALVTSAVFSPDGQRIVTGSLDQTAKVWELAGCQGPLTLKAHTKRINSAAFSPDSQRVVTASDDQTAKVWELASGKELLTLKGHSAQVLSVAFSPDGQRIVTGSQDQTAKLWEATNGVALLTLKGHSGWINSVAFSPDGKRIVTAGNDQTAKVWEAATGNDLLTFRGHGSWISSVAFSPDGQRIVSGSYDQTAKLWEAASGKELLTFKGHDDAIQFVAFSPDGQRIVTAGSDLTAKLWEAATGKELLTFRGHSIGITSVAFSPDGQRIVSGGRDGTTRLWEAASGKELLTLKGRSIGISSVAFSTDGRRFVTCSDDQMAKVWEAATADQVATWQKEEQAAAEYLAARQRELAAAAERDRDLRVQDPGAIRQWLVLLPIAFEGQEGARALQDEQVAKESRLRPRAGERIKTNRGGLVWFAASLEDYRIDFNRLAGTTTEWAVAYAVSYIQSELPRSGVLLKVSSDDQAKVYLNGNLVYQRTQPGSYRVTQGVAGGLELRAALNVLVFKVVNETAGWEGSVRLTDAAGQPLKGIRVTLDPEAKD